MAEQQYIYVAAPAVVANPASYAGYSNYSQPGEATYVQPGYTTMPAVAASYGTPSYQYDPQSQQYQQTAPVVAQNAGQPDYSQSSYTSPAVSSHYSQPSYGGGQVTAFVSAAPYTVVSSSYASPTEQATTYSQHPGGSYGQPVGQQPGGYVQQPGQPTLIYGQAPSQLQLNHGQPGGQPTATYVQQQPTGQQLGLPPGYGQPAGQTAPSPYGIQHQPTAYASQALAGLQANAYGATLVAQQASAYGQPTSIQPPAGYGQPPGQQQPPAYAAQPPLQAQTLAYGQPSGGQPTMYGQPGAQLAGYNPQPQSVVPLAQQPQVFITAGGGPPASLMGGGGFALGPPGRTLSIPGAGGPMGGNPAQFSNHSRGGGGPSRGFGGDRGGDRFGGGGDHHGGPGGGDRGEIEIHQFPDTVFVQGLPDDITEEMLIQQFGAVGKLKTDSKTGKSRVWLVKDKLTGRPRGEATIGFENVENAATAIDMFNNKDFHGRKIRVEIATRKVPLGQGPGGSMPTGRGGMNDHGGRGGGGGGRHRGGSDDALDWICSNPNCGNQNFAWRVECNRCKGPRSENGSPVDGPPDGGQRSGFRGRGRGDDRGGRGMQGGRGGFRGGPMGSPGGFRGRGGPPGGPMRGRGRMDRRGGRPY